MISCNKNHGLVWTISQKEEEKSNLFAKFVKKTDLRRMENGDAKEIVIMLFVVFVGQHYQEYQFCHS